MTSTPKFLDRTPDETTASFRDRYEELEHSASRYDQGRVSEAPRLGLLVYLLAVDKGQRSLISQVGKGEMSFVDTRIPVSRGQEQLPRRGLQLVALTVDDEGWEFQPSFGAHGIPPTLPRKKWLSRIVLSDNRGRDYRTGDVVEFFRHKEGGGHYDPQIEEGYASLLRDKTVGFKLSRNADGSIPEPRIGPLHATMRQVAYELELSIRITCSDLLNQKQRFGLAQSVRSHSKS